MRWSVNELRCNSWLFGVLFFLKVAHPRHLHCFSEHFQRFDTSCFLSTKIVYDENLSRQECNNGAESTLNVLRR